MGFHRKLWCEPRYALMGLQSKTKGRRAEMFETALVREVALLAAPLDGKATNGELIQARCETSETIVAMRASRAVVERQMAALGVQIPAKEADPS